MKKLIIIAILMTILISGCSVNIVKDGRKEVLKGMSPENYVKTIDTYVGLKQFCKINNYVFPPTNDVGGLLFPLQDSLFRKYKEIIKIEAEESQKIVERVKKECELKDIEDAKQARIRERKRDRELAERKKKNRAKLAEMDRRIAEKERKRRQEYIDYHISDKRYAKHILSKSFCRGMSTMDVRVSIGSPERINTSVGSYGKHEQWVYSNGYYLYFEDDILNSWQY